MSDKSKILYRIVSVKADECLLCQNVNALMRHGWKPLGGVAVNQSYLVQAMTINADKYPEVLEYYDSDTCTWKWL